jgi:hypothetical protein
MDISRITPYFIGEFLNGESFMEPDATLALFVRDTCATRGMVPTEQEQQFNINRASLLNRSWSGKIVTQSTSSSR